MSGMNMDEFLKDTKGRKENAEHFNLKATGKGIVFLHPESGIYKRNVYWMPVYGEVEENGSKVMRTYNTMIVCPGADKNPIAQLRKAIRDDEDIDMDEVVLKVGEGDQVSEYTKGDIIGEEGYDWKKSLAYKTEYLFGVINKDNPAVVHPFVAPKSLGKKITKVIEDQIEEEGEDDGNPFKNPYAFKLTFDKDASPTEMYNATWNKASVTDEIKDLIEGPGPDLKALVEPTEIAKIAYLVKSALVLDEDELGLDLSAADSFDADELKRGKKEDDDKSNDKPKKDKKPAKKESKPPKTVEKSAPKDDDDDDEYEEIEVIDCPECEEEIPADSETCPKCGSDVAPF